MSVGKSSYTRTIDKNCLTSATRRGTYGGGWVGLGWKSPKALQAKGDEDEDDVSHLDEVYLDVYDMTDSLD